MESEWIAEFEGATVVVTDDGWSVFGPDADEVERQVHAAAADGWPSLPGWDIDTSPGWDDDWTFLRLAALGAKDVTGPNPHEDASDPEPGVIVG